MAKLLIAADDFTGALDTAVQFSANGADIRVITDPVAELQSVCDCDVLVVDTETRHLPPEDAAKIIAKLTLSALENGITYLFKKTDSALRGNVGAELAAMLRVSGEKMMPFLPSFPQLKRFTKGGIHYIQDIPVAESVFGQDPFEPVRFSSVTELLSSQTDMPTHSCPAIGEADSIPELEGIAVFDGQSVEDLEHTGQKLLAAGKLKVMAGCAGFASVLGKLLHIGNGKAAAFPRLSSRMMVICGSVNPITVAQLDEARENGFAHLRLTPEQKLCPGYWDSPAGEKAIADIRKFVDTESLRILDTNDSGSNQPTSDYAAAHGMDIEDIRQGVSKSVGCIVSKIIDCDGLGTMLVTGGDTLLQCMNFMGVDRLSPIGEFAPGIVLSRFEYHNRTHYAITKSGGFGTRDLIVKIANQLKIQTS